MEKLYDLINYCNDEVDKKWSKKRRDFSDLSLKAYIGVPDAHEAINEIEIEKLLLTSQKISSNFMGYIIREYINKGFQFGSDGYTRVVKCGKSYGDLELFERFMEGVRTGEIYLYR